jgi:hypothetical protein
MEDLRRPRYRYDVVSRQAILDSISIFNPDVAKILIDECEIVATIHLHTIAFQANFPNCDGCLDEDGCPKRGWTAKELQAVRRSHSQRSTLVVI